MPVPWRLWAGRRLRHLLMRSPHGPDLQAPWLWGSVALEGARCLSGSEEGRPEGRELASTQPQGHPSTGVTVPRWVPSQRDQAHTSALTSVTSVEDRKVASSRALEPGLAHTSRLQVAGSWAAALEVCPRPAQEALPARAPGGQPQCQRGEAAGGPGRP